MRTVKLVALVAALSAAAAALVVFLFGGDRVDLDPLPTMPPATSPGDVDVSGDDFAAQLLDVFNAHTHTNPATLHELLVAAFGADQVAGRFDSLGLPVSPVQVTVRERVWCVDITLSDTGLVDTSATADGRCDSSDIGADPDVPATTEPGGILVPGGTSGSDTADSPAHTSSDADTAPQGDAAGDVDGGLLVPGG